MSGYSVRIAPRAERDFDRIIAWLAERSVSGAKKLEAAFGEAVRRLVENPFLYPLATADELRRLGVRQDYFKTRHGRPYRALFTVAESTVWILHVRGPGQRGLDVIVPPPEE